MGSSIPIVSYMQGLSFVFRAKKKILAGYAKVRPYPRVFYVILEIHGVYGLVWSHFRDL